MDTVRIAITGAAGQLAYSLIFRLATGELFPNKKVALHLLEVADSVPQLDGVRMELEDLASPYLSEVKVGSDPYLLFGDIDYAFLVGAKPRGPGMERKELLQTNGHIFQVQGQALDRSAKKSVEVLVVGNPCNTNCLIALHNAPSLSPNQFYAMTRLDENRGKAFLAKELKVSIEEIEPMIIWGNHSSTLVADVSQISVKGKKADTLLSKEWLLGPFMKGIQQRGAEVIKARGKSSAASAGKAALDAMKAITGQTKGISSMAMFSKNNSYGIDEDLVFSYPCKFQNGLQIVEGLRPDDVTWNLVLLSEKELKEERDAVLHLMK